MTLSREEIAVRVNEALLAYVEAHGHSPGCDVSMFVGREKCNCGYTELACALRAILLTLTPAPVAPPAGKYEPRPGDVVRFVVYGQTNGDGVVVAIQREGVASIRLFGESVHALTWGRYFRDLAYLRPATPSELAAAGLAVPPPATAGEAKRDAERGYTDAQMAAHRAEFESWALALGMNTRRADSGPGYDSESTNGAWWVWEDRVPFSATPAPETKCDWCGGPHVRDVFHAADATPAPEAKRPEWVRIVKSESPSRFKDGDVLRVVKWVDEVPAVDVDGYDVSGYVLYDSKWAPAPCPPPVAGRGEDDMRSAAQALLDALGDILLVQPESSPIRDKVRALRASIARTVRS